MPLKSYPASKALYFSDMQSLPIYLGNLDGRVYYSFSASNDPPSGGKNVTTEELDKVRLKALPFVQIKQEAEKRIINIAPLWRQQNALVDLFTFGQKETPTLEEQQKLDQAKSLIDEIQSIRARSNEIENSLLNGELVDYQTDNGWNIVDAE